MNIIESTVAMLFRHKAPINKAEQHRRRTAYLLREITDPAESVGECLIEQRTKNDHDHHAKAKHRFTG